MSGGAAMSRRRPEPARPDLGDTAGDRSAGLALIREHMDVSRETEVQLGAYAAELIRWSRAKNLIGPDTLGQLWTRHIADSAQVLSCAPEARSWVDLGSGAGFPGLVVSILLAGVNNADVHLVESNGRKCAFLRAAARQAVAPATVHCQRIEAFIAGWQRPVHVVTARALAPLSKLLEMTAPLIEAGAIGVFHKGQDVEFELTQAATCWKFSYQLVPSWTHSGSALVIVRDCERKTA